MSDAILRIRAEGGPEVARLLADVERLVDMSRRRVAAGERQQRAGREREAAHYRQSARQTAEEVAASERLVTRARLRELALQGEAQERFRRVYADAETRATAIVRAETGNRGALTEREKRAVESAALAMVAAHDRAERERTATTRREGEQRKRIASEVASATGEAINRAHAAMQGGRERVARIDATLGSAFGEGGATVSESAAMSARVWQFARDRGMDPEALAASLQASQQQFSSLSGATAADRTAALDRALGAADLARDAMSDPAQVMRLSGALGVLGNQDTINGVLRSAIGISRRGGVELGALSAQNLSTIQSQMAAAVANLRRENPNATEGDARGAMVEAFTQTLAQLEVLDPRGLRGRQAGTAVRQLGSALHDPRVATALRTRLEGVFGRNSAEVSRFFDGGNLRAEYLGAMGGENFGRAMTAVAGGDPDRIRSLLGRGTRTGDRGEVLHANQRDMIAMLAGQDARGRTGWDALVGMREGARDVNDSDLARTRAIVEGLDQTRLTRAEVGGMMNARRPSGARDASDAAADWAREHPLLAAATAPFAGLLGRGALGALRSRVMPTATGALARLGAGAAAGAALPAAVGGAVLTYTDASRDSGDLEARAMRRINAERRAATAAGTAGASPAATPPAVELSDRSVERLAAALSRSPVTVDPMAAAHAATAASARVPQ